MRQRPKSSAGGHSLGRQAQENRATTSLSKFKSFLPPPLLCPWNQFFFSHLEILSWALKASAWKTSCDFLSHLKTKMNGEGSGLLVFACSCSPISILEGLYASPGVSQPQDHHWHEPSKCSGESSWSDSTCDIREAGYCPDANSLCVSDWESGQFSRNVCLDERRLWIYRQHICALLVS